MRIHDCIRERMQRRRQCPGVPRPPAKSRTFLKSNSIDLTLRSRLFFCFLFPVRFCERLRFCQSEGELITDRITRPVKAKLHAYPQLHQRSYAPEETTSCPL